MVHFIKFKALPLTLLDNAHLPLMLRNTFTALSGFIICLHTGGKTLSRTAICPQIPIQKMFLLPHLPAHHFILCQGTILILLTSSLAASLRYRIPTCLSALLPILQCLTTQESGLQQSQRITCRPRHFCSSRTGLTRLHFWLTLLPVLHLSALR